MPEMKVFWPEMIQSEPSRRAVVVIRWLLLPASGSVIAKAAMVSPEAMPGSQRCFCSSVPNREMMVPLMAGRPPA